jgi:glutamine amidotransferase
MITDEPDLIKSASKVILPGVGEAGTAMKHLKQKGLDKLIVSLQQPVLGICLGLQLLCKYSEEGQTNCLGIFNATVKKFPALDIVPHMGWNNLVATRGLLFNNITHSNDVYFVHGYYAEVCDDTVATCNYIVPFSAAMQRNNFYATQFHTEKSAETGELILNNFLAL